MNETLLIELIHTPSRRRKAWSIHGPPDPKEVREVAERLTRELIMDILSEEDYEQGQ